MHCEMAGIYGWSVKGHPATLGGGLLKIEPARFPEEVGLNDPRSWSRRQRLECGSVTERHSEEWRARVIGSSFSP